MPKFGEWDVNNPASAEGYTVIFKRARDEKKKPVGASSKTVTPRRSDDFSNDSDSVSGKVNFGKSLQNRNVPFSE